MASSRLFVPLVALLLPGCRTPTSVELRVSTDVKCEDHPSTAIIVSRSSTATAEPATITTACQPDGTIGSLVILPASSKDETLLVRVVTSFGGPVETACAPPNYGPTCIVSRRQLAFVPHEELVLPVEQAADCAGLVCGESQTCKKGSCVSAQVNVDHCKESPEDCGIELFTPPQLGETGGQAGSAGGGGAAGRGGFAGMAIGGTAGGGAAGMAGAGGGGGAGMAGMGGAGQGGAGMSGAGMGGAGMAGAGMAGAGMAGDGGQGGAGMAGDGGQGGAGMGGGGMGGGLVVPPLPPLPPGTGTGTTYYVSPQGNDSNDGKSQATPWQTLGKVMATTYQAGDSVLLEGGASFTGCMTFSKGMLQSTSDAPFLLGSYGTGAFQLTADCTAQYAAAITVEGVDGFVLTDGIIRGNAGGARYGVYLKNETSGVVSHGVRVQNCDISGFYSKETMSFGGEIFVNGIPYGLDGVSVLNSTLHGSDGPTSLDDNGITGFGSGHNITNVLYQGNTVYDIGGKPGGANGTVGNGILLCGIDGGTAQYNVVYRCGGNTNTCGGPGGLWAYRVNQVTLQYNEVYGMSPAVAGGGGCDWGAFDLDSGVTNSVVQYNYAHDNVGPGFLTYISETWSGNTFRYNLGQNNGVGVAIGGYDGTTPDLQVYNNTLFNEGPQQPTVQVAFSGGGSVAGNIANNIFSAPGNAAVVDAPSWNKADLTELFFHQNDYWSPGMPQFNWNNNNYLGLMSWSSSTGHETKNGAMTGFEVDPMLLSPGSGTNLGGYNPGALSGYLLGPTSPLRGQGLDLAAEFMITPGSKDFFGKTIPHKKGTGYNVGADGSP